MNIAETRNLCCDYDGEMALKNVNISIPKGKMTFIMGGNGAGKSTLFLALNGIIKPSSGEIYIDGKRLEYDKRSIRRIRSEVGIVFQNPDDQLFCPSVWEDVSFGAVNMGLCETETIRRTEEAMKITETYELRNKSVHALSCGQKKRVAIAGVLVMEPKLLILDEPTAGLDPRGTSRIMSAVKRIQREKGITVVISTHDMDMAPVFADWVYILDGGEVAAEGDAEDIFSDPGLLREHKLRLSRISHLMEILEKHDGIDVSPKAASISSARRELKKALGKQGG